MELVLLLLVVLLIYYKLNKNTDNSVDRALSILDAEIKLLSKHFKDEHYIHLLQEKLRTHLYPIQKQHQNLYIVEVVENLDLFVGDFAELLSSIDILRFWIRNLNEYNESNFHYS